MKQDVLILGGGIIGVSLALELTLKGRSVVLAERASVGAATSFGNAGLIQSEAFFPYAFPRDLSLLLAYGLNLKPEANYHIKDLWHVAPFLWRYFRASTQAGQLKTAYANAPLFHHCLAEHSRLAKEAGAEAQLRSGGWIRLYRSQANLEKEITKTEQMLRPFGVEYTILDRAGIKALEPHLSPVAVGGIHWGSPYTLEDPEALTLAYFQRFLALGGKLLTADALTLANEGAGWSVASPEGRVYARDCVVCLGPWAPDLLHSMGYSVPMGMKRGYHIHMRPQPGVELTRPVLDSDIGYVMAPMARGLRLTSGAEFAHRDSPATPVQIDKIEPHARALFPLEGRVEAQPWMGARPCMPDMLPVLGQAPRHKNLWLNFGHAHHGLTLSAVCARLLGELITGEAPFTDPTPYSLTRF